MTHAANVWNKFCQRFKVVEQSVPLFKADAEGVDGHSCQPLNYRSCNSRAIFCTSAICCGVMFSAAVSGFYFPALKGTGGNHPASSFMMAATCASKFRSLVQSNTSRSWPSTLAFSCESFFKFAC